MLYVSKRHFLEAERREIGLREIFENNAGFCNSALQFNEKGIHLEENTPEEICDLVIEMVERLEGLWRATEAGNSEQSSFGQQYSDFQPRDPPLHGEFRAKFGAVFLRKSPDFLTPPLIQSDKSNQPKFLN